MAYQTRQRDPLFDSDTQAVLERRGKELLGLILIALGLATTLMLGTAVPDDPSWFSVTQEPAQNLLGRFGASVSAPLLNIVGWGAWGFPVVFFAWGLRFMAHMGEDRATARLIFAPLAIALAAVYASTHEPPAGWTNYFGLGGLFGDTILGAVLGVVPVKATFGLKLTALIVAGGMLAMGLFALGFTRSELQLVVRFLVRSVLQCYDMTMNSLGRGAVGLGKGAATGFKAAQVAGHGMAARRAQSKAEAAETARLQAEADMAWEQPETPRRTPVLRADPRGDFRAERSSEPRFDPDTAPQYVAAPYMMDDSYDSMAPAVAPAARASLLDRLPSLFRRPAPADAPVVDEQVYPDLAPMPEGDDRIKAKIADVIKSRVRARPFMASVGPGGRAEPPVLRARHPRGPQPMVLNTKPAPTDEMLPAEPPLQAASVVSRVAPAAPNLADTRVPAPVYHAEYDDDDDDEIIMPECELVAATPMVPPVFRSAQAESAKSVVQHAPKKALVPSRQAQAEAQPALQFEEKYAAYERPPLSLLSSPDTITRHHLSDEALEENARMLESVLDDYGVKGEIVSVRPGPVVTMYELEPAPGLKASRVIGLSDDIARSMSALSARVSTVPGRSVIGIELPNVNREMCVLREILASRDFGDSQMRLPLALGKDIGGDPVVANLAKMPHLLIAGTTGSGKSVAINTMILSLLYKLTPEECRMIMIDPKMLELSVYDGIPHLLSPVVTDPKKAVVALKWTVGEMEERYRKMSKMGVRNIEGYNGRVREALSKGEMFSRTVQTGFDDNTGEPVFETEEIQPEILPFIVVIVDEMADLMMVAGKEIEACIQRLAQMARASGIHLIMATQRPSVDVITGTIKANFPTRISFQVTSKIDSRTILGEMGAEQLLGMGDMLYMAGGSKIVRVHGPFCSDEEVEEIVNFLKGFGPPEYMSGVVEGPDESTESNIDAVLGLGNGDGEDALYDQAVSIVIRDRKCSTSYIQRKLGIGYNKAARLVEQMEDEGVVSSANHVGKREILVPEQH
ncbi:DNA translocase FtsK [Oceaniovalibus sp. ACAM 378]|uniref:DNA translocase FtsK n=1 Tax=Oceaniovalibus sp. ACAM 378 TaxID=2599923 RepID=UPI0011D45291|nr:DNA translocase FtsK [Oceaniovalibus sp. ACAM 378]TYB89145.1 DNA translocase FtsK [Oceaniovalibus sp. ACAM 378]